MPFGASSDESCCVMSGLNKSFDGVVWELALIS